MVASLADARLHCYSKVSKNAINRRPCRQEVPGTSMSQNYGVLRVVRVRPPANKAGSEVRYPAGWLPEEGLVHVLTRRETTIGRALNNHIILMDPTVSREHARLVLDQDGWHIINLTMHNVVRVNGQPV